uniref:Uncharacterized protein n=1 Tax=Candidatus Kentrum eta TaxID=2126337 RepID=A0A450UUT8_9GAMM|nr:MAG: hypothetical protein BECKH772B_GA0070898_100901 [Candidatus Kentron sp. H]
MYNVLEKRRRIDYPQGADAAGGQGSPPSPEKTIATRQEPITPNARTISRSARAIFRTSGTTTPDVRAIITSTRLISRSVGTILQDARTIPQSIGVVPNSDGPIPACKGQLPADEGQRAISGVGSPASGEHCQPSVGDAPPFQGSVPSQETLAPGEISIHEQGLVSVLGQRHGHLDRGVKGAQTKGVSEILETLAALGQAGRRGPGRYRARIQVASATVGSMLKNS